MGLDLTDLVDTIRRRLLALFEPPPAPADTPADPPTIILAFEPLGVPISLGDLKLHPDDPGPSPGLAIERVSTYANDVPAIESRLYRRTGRRLDGAYGLLLQARMPEGSPDDLVAVFEATKAAAAETFDQVQLGSLEAPTTFHPAYADPSDWYDPAAPVWSTIHVSSAARPAAAGLRPRGRRLGRAGHARRPPRVAAGLPARSRGATRARDYPASGFAFRRRPGRRRPARTYVVRTLGLGLDRPRGHRLADHGVGVVFD